MRIGDRSAPLLSKLVDPHFFEVLALEPLRGRLFMRGDEGRAVVVISRRTADSLWPGQDPLEKRLDVAPQDRFGSVHAGGFRVIGVVDDVVSGWYIGGIDSSAVYFPAVPGTEANALVLRVRDASHSTLEAVRVACAEMLPTSSCEVMPLTSVLQMQRLPFVIAAGVSAALGWTALAITCLGLYGLVSYLVVQKRREIGVRLALGAQPSRVTREVLACATRQIAIGVSIGMPIAFALSRLAASLSDKLRAFDPVSFVLVPIVLAGIAVLAAWIPARRSGLISPTVALREE
jgi:hypothetical protein